MWCGSHSSLATLALTVDEGEGRYGRITATGLLKLPAYAPFLKGFEPRDGDRSRRGQAGGGGDGRSRRAGRQSRAASPEELSRVQQQRGAFRAELRPISGASSEDLDHRRLDDYVQRVRGQTVPDQEDRQDWVRLLSATEFLVEGVSEPVPSLAAIERATLRGPLAPLPTSSGELVEPGLVDSAVAFIRRNVGVRAELVGGTRRVAAGRAGP